MLAPLRDHLRPKDPSSSPLLVATKEIYFTRLSGEILPGKPGFEEARWITAEDVNVEHLLDVFTRIDADSESTWDACARFMAQLYYHKSRLVMLGPKIELLPDDHPSKPQCLFDLSALFQSVGNSTECKRLLSRSLKLWREQGNDFRVARTLTSLSDANRGMHLHEEGVQQAEEASKLFERLGEVVEQADSLIIFALSLCQANQLNAAEEAGLRAVGLLPEKGEEFRVHQCHCALGDICRFKGETKKAIYHFEKALGIASSLNTVEELFWDHFGLAWVFYEVGELASAQTHAERAKSHAFNNPYHSARAMDQQAHLWNRQRRFEDAKSEALRALDAFEKLGAVDDAEDMRKLLRELEAREPGRRWPFKWRR